MKASFLVRPCFFELKESANEADLTRTSSKVEERQPSSSVSDGERGPDSGTRF